MKTTADTSFGCLHLTIMKALHPGGPPQRPDGPPGARPIGQQMPATEAGFLLGELVAKRRETPDSAHATRL